MFCIINELKVSTRWYVFIEFFQYNIVSINFQALIVIITITTTTNYLIYFITGNSNTLFHSPAPTAHLHNGIELKENDHSNCNEKDSKEIFFQLLLQMPKDKNSHSKSFFILVSSVLYIYYCNFLFSNNHLLQSMIYLSFRPCFISHSC